MNEIIQAIQVIKMYTWESSFAKLIAKLRRKEMNVIQKTNYINAFFNSLMVISRISIFLSLLTYVMTGNVITARKVFTITSLYNTLNRSFVLVWPRALTRVTDGWISMMRVQEFLLRPEDKIRDVEVDNKKRLTKKFSQLNKNSILMGRIKNGKYFDFECAPFENKEEIPISRRHINTDANHVSVKLINATAVWTEKNPENGIFNMNLMVDGGSLCAVIGPVGSGKSTLLNVIIGELDLDEGDVEINGRLSYAGQEQWLFGGTVRQNIIFVDKYDEKRYKEVCRVCALERDFEIWPYADQTLVGERGITLSGGQRARVNLARAVYRSADIYLLDDPLSAVDTHVGKHIFQECIQDFLSNKCVILVTHQLQYLKNVQQTIHMENGHITAQGHFRNVQLKINSSMSRLSNNSQDSSDTESINEETIEDTNNEVVTAPTEKEKLQKGSVKLAIYKTYIQSVQSKFAVALCILVISLSHISRASLDFFVAKWVNWEEIVGNSTLESNVINDDNSTNNKESNLVESNAVLNTDSDVFEERKQYVITYAILAGIFIYLIFHRNFAFFSVCYRASVNLHDKLFKGVTRATMYFFNNNPSGRILNRFSMDIGNVDSLLPIIMMDTIQVILYLILN